MPAMLKAASPVFSLPQLAPVLTLNTPAEEFSCVTRGETETAESRFVNVANRNTPHHESLPS
jgi:hypothetical protein